MNNIGNVRSFRKQVREMEIGSTIYINSINMSLKGIDALREFIKAGVLEPIRAEVEKTYKDVEAVMSGNVIIPQMEYIKKEAEQ